MKSKPRHELTFALCDKATDALLISASDRMPERTDLTIHDQYLEAGDAKNKKTGEQIKSSSRQYRVRRMSDSRGAFLQCRKWSKDVGYLRQTEVPTDELSQLTSTTVDKSWSGHWFQKRVEKHKLQSPLEIRFDRTVLQALSVDSPGRLTIDRAIHLQRRPAHQRVALQTNIVRMTFDMSLPAVLKGLIYEFALLPESPTVLIDMARIRAVEVPAVSTHAIAASSQEAACLTC